MNEMKTLKEAQSEIIEEMSMFDDWLDKYSYLIDLGATLETLPESSRTEDNLIKGCQSRVWLDCQRDGEVIYFKADSDALITKAIIALLVRVYSGRRVDEIRQDDFSFLDSIGLKENLSPTRAGGLNAMIAKIKSYAL